MLKRSREFFKNRRKSSLEVTPGEAVRDGLIREGIKIAEEAGYKAGNLTERLVNISEYVGKVIDRGTELVGTSEAAGALGRISYKATKDVARGDSVCTGLCLVAATSEGVAIACTTLKFPGSAKIYVGAKAFSKGCIAFRNSCVGEGC